MKYEKGFSREENNKDASSALIETANILVEEIKKVFVYWNSINNFNNIKGNSLNPINVVETSDAEASLIGVKKVLIAGREAGIIGFRDFLAISLKIPVEIANVWINILSLEDDVPEISMKESLSYGTAFGLALLKDQ